MRSWDRRANHDVSLSGRARLVIDPLFIKETRPADKAKKCKHSAWTFLSNLEKGVEICCRAAIEEWR